MNAIFKKLQFKNHDTVYILNAPEEFQQHIEDISEITKIHDDTQTGTEYEFVIVFVQTIEDVEKYANNVVDKIIEDAMLWFAYPKKSSKKYSSEITRDSGWESLNKHGYRPIRQIAIDEDWSALRFRHENFVKT